MTEEELVSFLEGQKEIAVNFFEDEISIGQQTALDRYLGKPYGDEMEGRSTALSLDVREAVDWMMPDLMRIFASGDKVVSFEPVGKEDEAEAEQRTDYVNHVFWKDNDGYMVLHDCFKDALIQQVGFIKVWWEEKEDVEPQRYEGISTIALAVFQSDPSLEIVDIKTSDAGEFEDPIQQQLFGDGKQHDISVLRDKGGRVKIMAIPPEEMLIAQESRTLEESLYVNHRVEKTRSDLVAEGLASRSEAEDLSGEDIEGDDRKRQRFDEESNAVPFDHDKLWVYEEHARIDFDDDGISERRQVIRVGNTVLSNEPADSLNTVSFTPTPMPHKVYGLGMADYASDIARIKTVITRGMLDNLYLTNSPRKVVNMQFADERTIDQMMDARVGAIIQVNGPVGEATKTDTTEFVGNAAFDMLAYMDSVGERRTGLTRTSQGLPEETLSRTATEVTKLAAAAQGRKELIVRNLANSLSQVFEKIDKLIHEHQDFARVIRLRGEAVVVDPRSWASEFDTTINVGLGTGNKEQKIAVLEAVLAKQIEAIGTGSGLSDTQKVYNTLEDWNEAAGLPVGRYFIDPASQEFQEPEEEEPIEIQEQQLKSQTDLKKTELNIASKEKIAAAELAGEAQLTAMELSLGENPNTNLRKP